MEPSRRSAAIAIVGAILYLFLAPAVVNGDGLGYLKAALEGQLYPGHLGYVPLLMLARWLARAGARAVDGLAGARLVSAIAAAVAAAALGATARRRVGTALAGDLATVGLLVSWGTLSAGSDVESYAPALAALTVTLYCLGRADNARWAIASGLGLALAVLFHVENLLFAVPAALLLGRRAPLGLGVAALVVGAAYALVLPTHGAAWLSSASHGLSYPLRATMPAIALYGACKALVYSPYPYEASWPRVLVPFAVGALLLGMALTLVRGARSPLPRAVVAAWLLPYALVGCVFYASDAERWTFLLPLLWLAVAATPRPRHALAVMLAIALANTIVWLPVARDDRLRVQARRAAVHLADGDLVIGPGHGWDEYIGFYEGPRVVPFPLVYWVGRLGGRAPLARELAVAAARTPRVFLARCNDDRDPLGWKELVQFGITRDNLRALLPPGELVAIGDGLCQLLTTKTSKPD
jgi:hypothetical protein